MDEGQARRWRGHAGNASGRGGDGYWYYSMWRKFPWREPGHLAPEFSCIESLHWSLVGVLGRKWEWVLCSAPKNWCLWTVVLEKTSESPLDCKEFQPVYPKGDQSWVFFGRTDTEAETPIFWPHHGRVDSLERFWCREGLGAGGEGDGRGWDGWMVSLSRWTWVGKLWFWWWTGRPGMLWFMGLQRVGQNWATELTHYRDRHWPIGRWNEQETLFRKHLLIVFLLLFYNINLFIIVTLFSILFGRMYFGHDWATDLI